MSATNDEFSPEIRTQVIAVLRSLSIGEKRPRTTTRWRAWIAYVAVGFLALCVAGLALAGLYVFNWSPTSVALIAAIMMLVSGATKLVAAVDDIPDATKDRLSLISQALALFGGSGGLVTLVGVIA